MNAFFVRMIAMVGLALAYFGANPNDASAVNPTGWRVVGKEITIPVKAHDGRIIVIGFADCTGPANAKGVVISCYRPNRVPARKVLSEAECSEFVPKAYAFKGLFSGIHHVIDAIRDVLDAIDDLVQNIDRFISRVIADIRGLDKATQDLVTTVVGTSGKFNKTFVVRSYAVAGCNAVVDHSRNVAAAAASPKLTLAERAAASYGRTLLNDKSGRLVIELCYTIMN